jgi:hypothetical protein
MYSYGENSFVENAKFEEKIQCAIVYKKTVKAKDRLIDENCPRVAFMIGEGLNQLPMSPEINPKLRGHVKGGQRDVGRHLQDW